VEGGQQRDSHGGAARPRHEEDCRDTGIARGSVQARGAIWALTTIRRGIGVPSVTA
jgi:hypothetical protein